MEHLTRADLDRLAHHQSAPAVSIFLPTHRHHPGTQQDPVRFGNLVRSVETALADQGWKPREIGAFLAQAHALLEDKHFWNHQQDGLAVYIDADEFHAYRLPLPVEERMVMGDRFFIAPLLPLFTSDGHFYILALSQNESRLFEGTRFTVGEVDLPENAPQSRAEMPGESKEDAGVQARTAGGAGGVSMFHGHGGGGEVERMRIGRYLNELDKSIQGVFRDGNAPLVIAGVNYLLPIYLEVTNYAHVVPAGPEGNPEMLRADELHAQAWPFVEEDFRASVEAAQASYAAQAGTGRTGAGLDEIMAAAIFGRVDTLLMPSALEVWGTVEAESGRVTRTAATAEHAGELAGLLAAEVLLNGGTVYAVEAASLPEGADAVAIYRY